MKNKYTQIPNDLFEIIPRLHLRGTEYDILFIVLRKTMGFHKKADWISNSQFANKTGKTKRSIWKALKTLVNKSILVKETSLGKTSKYRLNLKIDNWELLVNKSSHLNKSISTSEQKFRGLVNKSKHTKETYIKENTTKENNYSNLEDLKEKDFQEIADHYKIRPAIVKSKYDDIVLWVGERPNNPKIKGRNWRLTLMKWIKRDIDDGKIRVDNKIPAVVVEQEFKPVSNERLEKLKKEVYQKVGNLKRVDK